MWSWLKRWLRPPGPPAQPPRPPEPTASIADYEAWREAGRRPFWLPLTREGQFADNPSHFGGIPDLAPDETWPGCPHCGVPMALLLQLDLATLPAEAPGRAEAGAGLLQLFGCTDCGALSEDGSALARRLPPAERSAAVLSFDAVMLAPRSIVGWRAGSERPGAGEWDDEQGLPPAGEDEECQGGDKLGGWPAWVQYAEYPFCPVCRQPQRLLFQIASQQGLDYMFSDVGTAYLMYCSQHPDQLSFSWQST